MQMEFNEINNHGKPEHEKLYKYHDALPTYDTMKTEVFRRKVGR